MRLSDLILTCALAWVLALLVAPAGWTQPLRAVAGRSFYMAEERGELLLLGDGGLLGREDLCADVLVDDMPIAEEVELDRGGRVTVPFPLAPLPLGDTQVTCVIEGAEGILAQASARVTRLAPRANAVQVDRISGGLIVDGLPFFPFGFYCYSPVQPTLAEEEVVKGFNMMSPYQSNDPERLAERRKYMDRCAELGMKVHYHLLHVAVSGSAATPRARQQREQLLRAEVETFRNHPALLAWYLSDEPDGNEVPPSELARAYQLVRELDPYHPVTIVFMIPEKAREYAEAMDIVMTDPYPIPQRPPVTVHGAIAGLVSQFAGEKPVWLVPQAFGGNEWWAREPTPREERVMTYLGVIGGATGVQYFIRHGLNGFPKSTSTWAECGRLALEVAELTPALLSREPRARVISSSESIFAGAWQDGGMIYLLAVNVENRPQSMRLSLDGVLFTGQAEALFENRAVQAREGIIEEVIEAYGTRAYRLPVGTFPPEDCTVAPGNRTLNPSFEDNPVPGTPEGCYADVGSGRGATYFTDSRVARHGRHAVRLVSPRRGQTVALRPYAPSVAQGKAYRLSVWAKAATPKPVPRRERRGLLARLFGIRKRPLLSGQWPMLGLSLPGVGERTFPLTGEWREYLVEGTIAAKMRRSWLSIALDTPGTAWVDLLQLVELPVPASPAASSAPPR